MLRPAHRVDDGRDFLHVAVFADGSKHVDGFEILIFGNAGDPLNGFRRVSRILLLQQLENAPWMLQGEVIGYICRQSGTWCRSSDFAWLWLGRTASRPSLA